MAHSDTCTILPEENLLVVLFLPMAVLMPLEARFQAATA